MALRQRLRSGGSPPIAPTKEEGDDMVRVDLNGPILTVRFDRPDKKNALTSAMFEAAADALVLGEADSKVRVFILAGAAGAFTSGNDISEFRDYAETGTMGTSIVRFMKTLATIEKPIVAAVDGLAIGIGTAMLLLCDHVVASEWSVFSTPFVELGLTPEAASTLIAPRLMGHQRAFELLVMGENFDAARAYEVGLVSRVVAPEQVEDVAFAAAENIANRPPEAVRATRNLMRGDRREITQRIDLEASGFAELLRSREARDAFDDFLSRRRR
jgi:enoyl-CoA hydratase/carnithine racemase